MRVAATIAALSGLATLGAAVPTAKVSSRFFHTTGALSRRAEQKTAEQIVLEIAPKSASCDAANTECATAATAAPHLINSMYNRQIYEPAQIGAVIALQALESVEFQYNRNKVPGRPGQGTRNMQMIEFNREYAASVPALSANIPADDDAVLDLLVSDEYSFDTAAWYMTTKCSASDLALFKTDPDAGWLAYNDCVGVNGALDERMAYWNAAKAAVGI